ncbi:hypothetical protein Agabi119p4_7867 [Agaricus bisporus var. burnettii]|uniref:BTB domain-containing protein n=1 Tax=Agaricus bisporus var. burnettii TaxID=192524 RepID=A0A8H7C7Q2_AGABI|nr:hypothetical protein Agabi119p4_7867 [Agaricus bisporus var. burnettii]
MPSSESSVSSIVVVPDSSDPRPTYEDPVSESETSPIPSSVIRDEDYYWRDGNCVIRVQDRLFKVHQYLFERDSDFFRTLFTLPQPEPSDDENQDSTRQGVDGQSDDSPIVCQDSVEDFKALCWALYARPIETNAKERLDIAQLLRVIVISNKYGLDSLRDWSLNVVEEKAWPESSQFVDSSGGWKTIERVFIVSFESQRSELIKKFEQFWLNEIAKPDERMSRRLETFNAALDATENYPGTRLFQGQAYYEYLRACDVFNMTGNTDQLSDLGEYVDHFPLTSEGLNDQRSARLSKGLFSLMRLRSKLSTVPAFLEITGTTCQKHPSNPQSVEVDKADWCSDRKRAEC